jgi:hypothetical protein
MEPRVIMTRFAAAESEADAPAKPETTRDVKQLCGAVPVPSVHFFFTI